MFRRLLAGLAILLVPLAALPAAAAPPVLVVYPFAVAGSVPETLGSLLSAKIAGEVTALGGVRVVSGPASEKPADYRSAARAAGADLYFSGSIVAVGTSFSAIENLVSTRSGTVAWSTTMQFRSVDDVQGQGERIRSELLRSAATPSPGTPGNAVDLITPAPVSGFAVVPVTGSALEGDRAFATRAIVDTLHSRGYTVIAVTSDRGINSAALCASTAAQKLIMGTLDTTRLATLGTSAQTTARLSLQTYDCRARALDLQPTVVNHIAPIANDAIRGAAEDAISAFPAPS